VDESLCRAGIIPNMDAHRIKEIIDDVDPRAYPTIRTIQQAAKTGARLGVFASSFNPPTTAHVELIRRSAAAFSLDEILALACKTNADKVEYECSLEDRLMMLSLTLAAEPHVSIGLSSHAFYVDMIDAILRLYPAETDLHFIVGFDTFERVLDVNDLYTKRYHREFPGRLEALNHLFERCDFIVAGRSGAGFRNVGLLVAREPSVPSARVSYLDFPADLGELSATEVRRRLGAGLSITGLVPEAVETYLRKHGLYAS
jgi:nicotinic acid mononucleotide adenylyltransferase